MTTDGLWYFSWWNIFLHWFHMVHVISIVVQYPVIKILKEEFDNRITKHVSFFVFLHFHSFTNLLKGLKKDINIILKFYLRNIIRRLLNDWMLLVVWKSV